MFKRYVNPVDGQNLEIYCIMSLTELFQNDPKNIRMSYPLQCFIFLFITFELR